jgi:hypothetical protein
MNKTAGEVSRLTALGLGLLVTVLVLVLNWLRAGRR